jgi:hypothetical protein
MLPGPTGQLSAPRDFGALWCEMVADFAQNYRLVDGMLIRYEELLLDPSVHRELCNYVEADSRPVETFDMIKGRFRRGKSGKTGPRVCVRRGRRDPEAPGCAAARQARSHLHGF